MNDIDVKALRTKLGISQMELANRLGVTVTTISRWEHGVKPIPAFRSQMIKMMEDK